MVRWVIGICFWGPVRRARPSRPTSLPAAPNRASRERPQPLGGSIGRTSHGCQGQMGIDLGSPRCRGHTGTPGMGMAPNQCPNRAGNDLYAARATRCRECGNGYPAGGLWAEAGHKARWRRIFSITAGCSMKAMMRMGPAHRGHTSGSTSYTCLMRRAQARFATDGITSLTSSMVKEAEQADRLQGVPLQSSELGLRTTATQRKQPSDRR